MPLPTTCKEVHRLTSESLDRDLSLTERAGMQLHFLACTACRNFEGQMHLLRQAMQRLDPCAGKDGKSGEDGQ